MSQRNERDERERNDKDNTKNPERKIEKAPSTDRNSQPKTREFTDKPPYGDKGKNQNDDKSPRTPR